MAICRFSEPTQLRLEHDEQAELVLDLPTELDLIIKTEPCQGRGASLTHSSAPSPRARLSKADDREIPMSEFTVTRTLKAPRERVWQALTQPSHFEGWLPAKPGTAVLDVRTGGSWQATVVSSDGDEIALTGRYDQVSEPDHLVMTVPGDVVTGITLTSAPNDSTQIAYTFDVDESMHTMVTESVDEVLGRVATVLAGLA